MFNFNDFIHLAHTAQDEDLLTDLFLGVTTPKERQEIAHRMEIIKRLLKGETHQSIANNLRVGVATVTRGSRELGKGRFKILKENS